MSIGEPCNGMHDLPVAIVPQVEQNLPSDAKNKAISDLTAACYQKASQLQLTKEEIASLSADFPDEAFQPGAAGKENLIYIEHAALRERLDQVIGMGQWCVIPIRRWEEKFTYQKEKWINNRRSGQFEDVSGSHVYVDGIMLIRGAFVGSAIGEMTYYPDNHTQNYGDAVEGAETAALRRCCKRLGIGLQAWRKDWCLGWWDRKNNKGRKAPPLPPTSTATIKTPAAPQSGTPQAELFTVGKNGEKVPINAKYRLQTLNKLQAAPGQQRRAIVEGYLRSKLWITGEQTADDFPLEQLPRNIEDFQLLYDAIHRFEVSQRESEVQP